MAIPNVASELLICTLHLLKMIRANYLGNVFCPNRKTLLQAMSSGGRVGFDAPYNPRGE